MNFIYALTCFSIIAAVGYHIHTARRNQARANYFFGLVETMLPKAFPNLFRPEVAPESDAQAGLTEATGQVIMRPGDADLKFQEHMLRTEVDELTLEILKTHAYGITYEAAYAKAEAITVARYAVNDRPLSAPLLAIFPNNPVPVGEAVPPPSMTAQAAQDTNHTPLH